MTREAGRESRLEKGVSGRNCFRLGPLCRLVWQDPESLATKSDKCLVFGFSLKYRSP